MNMELMEKLAARETKLVPYPRLAFDRTVKGPNGIKYHVLRNGFNEVTVRFPCGRTELTLCWSDRWKPGDPQIATLWVKSKSWGANEFAGRVNLDTDLLDLQPVYAQAIAECLECLHQAFEYRRDKALADAMDTRTNWQCFKDWLCRHNNER
jgi:hypothetical protein